MTQYLDSDTIFRLRKAKEYLEKNGKTATNIRIAMHTIVLFPGIILPNRKKHFWREILPRLYAFSGIKKPKKRHRSRNKKLINEKAEA